MNLTTSTDRHSQLRARLWALVRLIHPLPVLIVMCAALLFGLLATNGRPDLLRLSLMLLALLGGQVLIGSLNEYHDREIDARAGRLKPLPRGLIAPRTALVLAASGGMLLLAAGAALGWVCLLLALGGTSMGVIYDLRLKSTVLSWLPYFVALPLLPIWVWTCLARFEPRLLLLYPVGAPIVVAVHLAQSLPDIDSDRTHEVYGLSVRLGVDRGFLAVCGMTLLAASVATIFGTVFGDRSLLVVLPGAVSVIMVMVAIGVRRRFQRAVDRNLFLFVALLTVALGLGLVEALG